MVKYQQISKILANASAKTSKSIMQKGVESCKKLGHVSYLDEVNNKSLSEMSLEPTTSMDFLVKDIISYNREKAKIWRG